MQQSGGGGRASAIHMQPHFVEFYSVGGSHAKDLVVQESPSDVALAAHDAEVEDAAGGGGDAEEVEDAGGEEENLEANLACSNPAYPWPKGMQFEEGLHGEESGEEGVEIMQS